MTEATRHTLMRLTLGDKARFLTSLVFCCALFLSVGWMVVEPLDPQGSVSLLFGPRSWLQAAQLAGLAVVGASITAVVVGPKLPDAGIFTVAFGMGLMALRGANSSYLLVHLGKGTSEGRADLALGWAVESLLWTLILAAAMVGSGIVARWINSHTGGDARSEPSALDWDAFALFDLKRPSPPESWSDRFKHVSVCVLAALLFIRFIGTRSPIMPVTHGQACFSIVGAFCLGTFAAFQLAYVRSALWSLLAVPIVALIGYVWTYLSPGLKGLPPSLLQSYDRLANMPPNAFARPLPIEYIAVGAVSVMVMFWYLRKFRHEH